MSTLRTIACCLTLCALTTWTAASHAGKTDQVDPKDASTLLGLLKNEAMRSSWWKAAVRDLSTSSCPAKLFNASKAARGETAGPYVPLKAGGEWIPYKIPAKCALSIETLCSGGTLSDHDQSAWAFPRDRVIYTEYIRLLAKRYAVPSRVWSDILTAMDNLALESASETLRQVPSLQTDHEETSTVDQNQADVESATSMDDGEIARVERRLAAAWNEYREVALNGIEIPALNYDPGCGDGDVSVEIVTQPPGGKVSLIDNFDWLICRKRNLNPWDPDSCAGWREVSSSTVSLAGEYRYFVRWPSGGISRSSAPITIARDNAKKVVLRR